MSTTPATPKPNPRNPLNPRATWSKPSSVPDPNAPPCRELMRDGAWLVPEEERPRGWENLPVRSKGPSIHG